MIQHKWASKKYFKKHLDDNSSSGFFEHSKNGYQLFRHKLILEFIKSSKFNKFSCFLDIGSAKGELTNMLKEKLNIKNVYGVDFLNELVEEASNKYKNIKFSTQQLPKLKFDEETFDLILLSEVLYYVKDQEVALEEIRRIIKKNGVLIITSNISHGYCKKEKLIELLNKNYFYIKKTEYIYSYLYIFITYPLVIFNRLISLFKKDQKYSGNFKMYFSFFKNLYKSHKIIRIISSYIARFSSLILKSQKIPELLNFKILPAHNIMIMAIKK